MSAIQQKNNFPKLHNAMWPGLVGKGSPGAEPSIDLDTMLDLTAKAQVNGTRFDGVDLFLYDPHTSIDISDDGIRQLADKISGKGFAVGSVVAPVWFEGSAMGDDTKRRNFLESIRKACRIARRLREIGVRPHGIVRIDSAAGVSDWATDPEGNQKRIAQTFREACGIAESAGERLAAEGEICWGGMHSWRRMVQLLEMVNRPKTLGFQADMAHTLLYTMGYNAPEDAILPQNYDWRDQSLLDNALKKLTAALRPWTIDFHVAQNDATVHGSGTHDKTGRHCLVNDPNGKLNITRHAGYWLRDANGKPTKAFRHICWDGCMFPNAVMMQPETWNNILAAMISVRDAHGWREDGGKSKAESRPVEIKSRRPAKATRKKARPTAAKPIAKRPAAKRTPAKRPAAKRVSVKTAFKKKSRKARVARKTLRVQRKSRVGKRR
jgi:sugar phosphate isomerase/epimerase